MRLNFFGTVIKISVPFIILISVILFVDNTLTAVYSLIFIIIHELGHIIAMKVLKVKITEIRLGIGDVGIITPFSSEPYSKIIVGVSGPLVNIISSISLLLFNASSSIAYMDLIIGVINLMPITCLDGGSVLKEILNIKCSYKKTEIISFISSLLFSLIVLLLSVIMFFKGLVNISFLSFGICMIIWTLVKIPALNL